ncbi:MAG: hypothetical protein EU536_03245 [Promethearchaeota archaeon]|nr:MAG: hypothetical protein EU536_03245 [Candidatus Lokiarchaeota archaeon]
MTEEAKKPLVYYSRIRELLRGTYEGNETKLNVSKDAREPLVGWLEELIKIALESLVEAMPTKTKGEQEGQLSRKTVKKGDITKGKRQLKLKLGEAPKKKGKK